MKRFLIFLLLINVIAVAQPWLPSGTVPQQIKGDGTSTPPTPPPAGPGWQRPADWLPLPEIAENDQRMVALFAVWPDIDNNIADIKVTCSTGYTVDWGDGSVDNYASNVIAAHTYNYDALQSGSYCSEGYKTVVVQAYPQGAGDITALSFKNAVPGLNNKARRNYLDILIQCGELTSIPLQLGAGTRIRQFAMREHKVQNLTNLLDDAISLRSVPELYTAGVSNLSGLFKKCTALRFAPAIDTASATNLSYMFDSCQSLAHVPDLDLSSAENLQYLFNSCQSLAKAPKINAPGATNWSYCFQGCASLVIAPEMDMAGMSSSSLMFSISYSVADLNIKNLSRSINLSSLNLSAESINRLFSSLGTPADGNQSINVLNNPGSATCDESIATAKGWKVTK